MSDLSSRIHGAGLPPPDGTTFNPTAGDDYPTGTPVCPSPDGDSVLPAQASAAATSQVIGIAAIPGVVKSASLTKFSGPLVLTTDQWDQVLDGGSGGLEPNTTYWLSATQPGRITAIRPVTVGTFQVPLGVAHNRTTLLINLGVAQPSPP